ncbi:MAG: hypothetical protein HY393_01960 [Candidatus Diapherotrites archaeon]|nr:hypothetical protein [Candidatus Diapherotrites archaeon]
MSFPLHTRRARIQDTYTTPDSYDTLYSEFEKPSPFDTVKGMAGSPETKEWAKRALLAIAAIAIGYGVYWYFIGSITQVTIEIRNTEDQLLSASQARVHEKGNTNSIKEFFGSTVIGLRPGNYEVKLGSIGAGYSNPGTIEFSVTGAEKEQFQFIEVEKALNVKISNVDLPDELVVEQQISRPVTFENNSSKPVEVELVFEGAYKELALSLTPEKVLVPANSTETATLTIQVPSDTKVSSARDGDAKTGSIRIKFTRESVEQEFRLRAKTKITVSPEKQFTLKATPGGKIVEKQLSVENKNAYALTEPIQASVVIDSAQNNVPDSIEEWFQWNQPLPLPALEKAQKVAVNIQVLVPISAKPDTITGQLNFSTSFWSFNVPFLLEVGEPEIELNVTLDGGTTKQYTLALNGAWETKTAKLRLSNAGEIELQNILVEIQKCSQEFINFSNPEVFPLTLGGQGSPTDTMETLMQISAPVNAQPGIAVFCELQSIFEDPQTGDPVEGPLINVQITPKAT